jgi:integrase
VREQFERHVFPKIGELAVADVRKADLLALLDRQVAAGKLRTANVLLTDLKQMLDFALERDIIVGNPLASIKRSKVGGANVERERILSDDELRELAAQLPASRLHPRNCAAIKLILATAVRVGELLGAVWSDALPMEAKARSAFLAAMKPEADAAGVKIGIVDLSARSWYLADTKNQRDHRIHLSEFALEQFNVLRDFQEVSASNSGAISPWAFPGRDNRQPVGVKSFGKQLCDRQRPPEARLQHRALDTTSLELTGGRWTAHDLRRTAATLMARLGFGSDIINECLNHVQTDRMAKIYIRDRRETEQVRAFDALGDRLAGLIGTHSLEEDAAGVART